MAVASNLGQARTHPAFWSNVGCNGHSRHTPERSPAPAVYMFTSRTPAVCLSTEDPPLRTRPLRHRIQAIKWGFLKAVSTVPTCFCFVVKNKEPKKSLLFFFGGRKSTQKYDPLFCVCGLCCTAKLSYRKTCGSLKAAPLFSVGFNWHQRQVLHRPVDQ